MSTRRDVTNSQLRTYFKVVQAAFFTDIVILLVPVQVIRGVVLVVTAPAVALFGIAIGGNWRGSIAVTRQVLTEGDSAFGEFTADWPAYFWRVAGASIALVGATMSLVGVVSLVP